MTAIIHDRNPPLVVAGKMGIKNSQAGRGGKGLTASVLTPADKSPGYVYKITPRCILPKGRQAEFPA
ncbi:hypothetical protein, partial [Pyrobaculum sp.]|uniref:hypothetical protein n=1 Tax=Pyrobaculum sp. TaxID=2004705 RepID=UPI003178FB16